MAFRSIRRFGDPLPAFGEAAPKAVLQLPSTALLAWWDANQGVYTDTGLTTPANNGNAVAGWKDRGPNGNHVTQGTAGDRPLYSAAVAALNNKPAVQFVSSDFLGRTVAAGIVSNLNIYTIYVIYASSVVTQSYFYAEGNSANNTPFVGSRIGPTNFNPVHNSDAAVLANPAGSAIANNGNKHLVTFRRAAVNSWSARLDGAQVGTDTTSPGVTTTDRLTIGALTRITTISFLVGYIAQIAIYSADNFATIEPILAKFYNIALP